MGSANRAARSDMTKDDSCEEAIVGDARAEKLIGEEVPAKRERDSYDRFFHIRPPSKAVAF
jgi:hypothetical protein